MLLNSLFKYWSYRIFTPGTVLRQTYDAFKELLLQDARAHDLMAEFEELYHSGKREDFALIRKRYMAFANAVSAMIENYSHMEPAEADILRQYYTKFNFYALFLLAPPEQINIPPFVSPLYPTPPAELIGNKAYNLALLQGELGLPVPAGFSITTTAFFLLFEHNNLRDPIDALLAEIDIEDPDKLGRISLQIQNLIRSADFPSVLKSKILSAYDDLILKEGVGLQTAVRSSAVCEDSVQSFAGQYMTILGVTHSTILESYLEVVASKYSPEALFYRIMTGLEDEEAPIAVLVLAMVDAAASGITYSLDTTADDKELNLLVHAIHGLGEPLVGGEVTPDIFTFNRESMSLVKQQRGRQFHKTMLGKGNTIQGELTSQERESYSISQEEASTLAKWGMAIEEYAGEPQDIEWARTKDGRLFLLQARPLHKQTAKQAEITDATVDMNGILPVLNGSPAAGGTAYGPVYLLERFDFSTIPENIVLVTPSTPPSLVRVLNRLVAVIAEQGSAAGHFATVCREFGVPLLVDTEGATTLLQQGMEVTVDGYAGKVFPGRIDALLENTVSLSHDQELPYFSRLKSVLGFVTPLRLIDPKSENFAPQGCRSLHDLIRYVHEKAVQAMFSLGEKVSGRSGKCRKLITPLPLEVFLLDVGGGFISGGNDKTTVAIQEVSSPPFVSLWKGLTHPGVDWHSHSHFDWKAFDDIALAGGVALKDSGDFSSYAIVSSEYLNLNMRFGYHFTLVDALCSDDKRTNYCQLRFAGGGGDYTGRSKRIDFLTEVLTRLNLEVHVKADLLDARITEIECKDLCNLLDMIGRLLGATKLMDMVLKEGEEAETYVEQFFAGRYSFTEDMRQEKI